MAEEVKEGQVAKCGCGAAKTAFRVIIGLALVGLGVWAVIAWWQELLGVVKGCLGLFLILAGAITVAIARD